ncbi:MAG: polyketide synthase [Kiritimatiellae bacterium]|nr:polyketide synthase [Kiritimatiellia bacterium]
MHISHQSSREDIVITGMACRFAGAANNEGFWQQIMTRQHGFSVLPEGEISIAPRRKPLFGRPLPTHAARLGNLYSAAIPPETKGGQEKRAPYNPDLFFASNLVLDALRDSRISSRLLSPDKMSFHLGFSPLFSVASQNWLMHTSMLDQTVNLIGQFFPGATSEHLESLQEQLTGVLPSATPVSFLSALSGTATSWIAAQLGATGIANSIDAGSLSCMIALRQAMDSLFLRHCDLAIAGAVQQPLFRGLIEGLSGSIPFSEEESLHPFSRESRGTLPGEGGAVFVLKRLKDAKQQGDRIYAIIRSVGLATALPDARHKGPTAACLRQAITCALREAGTVPESFQMVEAHGSGIPVSDQTELSVYSELAGDGKKQPLIGVGSVKGNVGHTLWGASAAGIAKTVLAIAHKQFPPSVPIERPYPQLMTGSPLYLLTESRPWLRGNKKHPRRACVTALSSSGSSAAAVLEEYPE